MDEQLKQVLKQIEESLTVLVHMQDRHYRMVKEHQEWLGDHTRAMQQLAESQVASTERIDRIESNLDRLTVLLLRKFGENGSY